MKTYNKKIRRIIVVKTIEYLYDITDFPKDITEEELIEAAKKKANEDFDNDIDAGNEIYGNDDVKFEG